MDAASLLKKFCSAVERRDGKAFRRVVHGGWRVP